MLSGFYNYLRFERRFSEHTVKAYSSDLSQFMKFAEIQTCSEFVPLSASFIRGWIVHLMENSQSNKSINRKLATLRTFYTWLRKEGLTEENPMLKISGPKTEKRLPTFAKEQDLESQKTALVFGNNFQGLRDELIFEFFYQTGVRLSELIQLKRDDVTQQTIKVLGKRNKERLIPISPTLHQKIMLYLPLRENISKTNRFFTLDNGKELYPAFVYRKIHALLGALTHLDKRSPHVLRHTFATHMLNHGAGLETLKELLGHASLAATQVYTHNSFAQLTKAYNAAHPRSTQK